MARGGADAGTGRRQHIAEVCDDGEVTSEAKEAAAEDWEMMRRALRGAARRRAVPRQGLGVRRELWPVLFQVEMQRVLEKCHAARRTPAIALNEGTGRPGIKCARIIHLVCPWWSLWYKHRYNSADTTHMPAWAHGFEEGRRREEAIIVTQDCDWRLRCTGRSGVWMLHDERLRMLDGAD